MVPPVRPAARCRGTPSRCSRDDDPSEHDRPRPDPGPRSGQALVETALVIPVLLFAGLGFLAVGQILGAQADQNRRTGVLAEWVASHPGEDTAAAEAAILPGCTIDYEAVPPDLIRAGATCRFVPWIVNTLWPDGLDISTDGLAVAATPSPSPSP